MSYCNYCDDSSCSSCLVDKMNDVLVGCETLVARHWGHRLDEHYAKFHFNLNEDGTIFWKCVPFGRYADDPVRSLILAGFDDRMREANPSNTTRQYMLDSAYNAGINPKCHTGFHIPYTSKEFTFKLHVNNPDVTFEFHEDDSDTITFRRFEIFSDKKLMDKFDAGVYAYIAANKEHLRARILREAKEEAALVARQRKMKFFAIVHPIFLFFYFSITSFIAVSLFIAPNPGLISTIVAVLWCGTSAVHNWIDRVAPIRVHLIMLILLGLFKWLLMFLSSIS